MITYKDSIWDGGQVDLDNSTFEKCRFKNCVLVYAGTGPVTMVECVFDNVKWQFKGAAANTLAFLKGMYSGMGEGGKNLVETSLQRPLNEPTDSEGIALSTTASL